MAKPKSKGKRPQQVETLKRKNNNAAAQSATKQTVRATTLSTMGKAMQQNERQCSTMNRAQHGRQSYRTVYAGAQSCKAATLCKQPNENT